MDVYVYMVFLWYASPPYQSNMSERRVWTWKPSHAYMDNDALYDLHHQVDSQIYEENDMRLLICIPYVHI